MSHQLTITESGEGEPPTMVIEINPPVDFRGGTIGKLELREPSAKQVREAEKELSTDNPWAGRTAYEQRLVGLVAGLSPQAMDVIPVGITNVAYVFVSDFVDGDRAGFGEEEDEEAEAPGPVALPIEPPLRFAGASYSSLDLREPTSGELKRARLLMRSGNVFENRRSQMQLVTSVSDLPAPVIEGLRISTLNQASRILARFIVAGRPTGKR